MQNYQRLWIFFIFITPIYSISQTDKYPKDYFRSPLDVPLYLAGNFGELRSNHFHAGIDIKTQQQEGLKVYGAAEGYVSRINISLYGYGKAIYVKHPNGMTTVYAHLQRFSPKIEEYVKKAQYSQKKFTIALYPKKGELNVSKGEVIALSGNTGGSGGPHLHFEIRNGNEVPLNPLLFGFKIKDDIKPILKNIALYPLNDTSTVNGKNEPASFKLYGSAGKYSISSSTQLKARGVIGAGIEVIDRLNGSNNRCGVYSIELIADSNLIYKHEMEMIPFDVSRYINSHVDYRMAKKNRKRIQKSFLDPNNKLNIYKDVASGGKLYFSKYGHNLDYVVKDTYRNKSKVRLAIAYDSVAHTGGIDSNLTTANYKVDNFIHEDSLEVKIPAFGLYKDLPLTWEKRKRHPKAVAPTFQIMDGYTPLHFKMKIKIKADSIAKNLQSKIYAVSLNSKGEVSSAIKGSYHNGWFGFKTKSFGKYSLMIDTKPPSISTYNFKGNGKSFASMKNISFTIKDQQSGIATYNGYIDGQWVLMEFDKKKKRLWYEFDSTRLERGKHSLKVVITDNVGNTKTRTIDFIW